MDNDGTNNKKLYSFRFNEGLIAEIDEIAKICAGFNIFLIEDAAESLGSSYKEKHTGTFGKVGAFSFNGNKIITAGGGGAMVSRDPVYAEKAKYLTNTAKVPHKWEYVHDELGYNLRMPNVNAALACAQLEELENLRQSKKALYEEYKSFFANTDIKLREMPENSDWNYWLICVELENLEERNAFLEATNSNGVMTRPIWQLMYRLPMYEDCQRDAQTNAEFLEERIVNIPSSARGGN